MIGKKTPVQFTAFCLTYALNHFYAGRFQFAEAVTVHFVVTVNGAHYHFRNPVADDGICTGRRLPIVRAGLQTHIQGATLKRRKVLYAVNGVDFSMVLPILLMVSLSYDAAICN